jgi:hypothetical protein
LAQPNAVSARARRIQRLTRGNSLHRITVPPLLRDAISGPLGASSRDDSVGAIHCSCLPRRPLRRVPGRALPSSVRRARGRVLDPGRVEGHAPSAFVVARELQIRSPGAPCLRRCVRYPPTNRAMCGGPRARGRTTTACIPRSRQLPGGSWLRWSSARYSMIWFARPSTDGGIVRPSAFAVFRFITNSNLVGCSTGRSAGFAPLRILSTWAAARRY